MTIVKYEQERVGDFIQVNSGRHFYPLDPRPEDIVVQDIAHSLSNLARFTGHGDRFYSVAEHSILCARIARKAGYDTLTQLYCLGHDASESVCNDIARPLKQNLPQYIEAEDRIMVVLWETLGLPQPTEEHYDVVKRIDNTMLIHELHQLMKRGVYPDLETEPTFVDLTHGYNAGEAKEDFLSIYNSLIKELTNA